MITVLYFPNERWFYLTASLVLGMSAAGCSKETRPMTYPVVGLVAFDDGSVLQGGTIEFESDPQQGRSYNGRGLIRSDGAFELTTFTDGDGAVAGRHRILVRPIQKSVAMDQKEDALPVSPVARSYQRYDTSELTATIKKEPNRVTLKLRKQAGR